LRDIANKDLGQVQIIVSQLQQLLLILLL